MSSNKVSRETPSQRVPSFDHRVTQCKSTVMLSVGNSRKGLQSHRFKTSVPSSIVNSHLSSDTRGVGPADNTGKSTVRYCPGGSFASAARRRPQKPLEIMAIGLHPIEVFLFSAENAQFVSSRYPGRVP